jgi:hypothetical protein
MRSFATFRIAGLCLNADGADAKTRQPDEIAAQQTQGSINRPKRAGDLSA